MSEEYLKCPNCGAEGNEISRERCWNCWQKLEKAKPKSEPQEQEEKQEEETTSE